MLIGRPGQHHRMSTVINHNMSKVVSKGLFFHRDLGSISYNVLGNYRSRCRTHGEACVERPVYQRLKGRPRTR